MAVRLAFTLVTTGLLSQIGAWRDVSLQPPVPLPDLFKPPALELPAADLTLYEMSVMEGWRSKGVVVTGEEIRTDAGLWRETFFRNWDALPPGVRSDGLAAMCRRFRRVFQGPETWDRMAARDWDVVPQPVRAMAILRMIAHWERHYRVGERFALPPAAVTERVQAIAMAESWFQHRAASRYRDGSEDLGVGQASAATRSRIRVLYLRGAADFGLAEEDYFDPWKASRALVFWFSLLLNEAHGDLDLATRGYNVGTEAARAGRGRPYLEVVRRRQANYLRGEAARPSWSWLRSHTPPTAAVAERAAGTLVAREAEP